MIEQRISSSLAPTANRSLCRVSTKRDQIAKENFHTEANHEYATILGTDNRNDVVTCRLRRNRLCATASRGERRCRSCRFRPCFAATDPAGDDRVGHLACHRVHTLSERSQKQHRLSRRSRLPRRLTRFSSVRQPRGGLYTARPIVPSARR